MKSPAVLIALCLTVTAALPAQFFDRESVQDAAISPDGGQVVFALRAGLSGRDGFGETLQLIPSTGGAPQFLAAGRRPAFAPSGGALAYLRPGTVQQLVVRDALTASDRVLSGDSLQVDAFRWSPDATQLAFTAGDTLFVVAASGGAPRLVTPAGFRIGPAEPELPDLIEFDWLEGNRLVVSGHAVDATDGPQAASLFIVDAAAGSMRYLIGRDGRWHTPVVSPNGDWIAFTGQALGPAGWMASEVIVIRPDGSGLRRLTAGRDLDALDLAWADDSRAIWFAVEERGSRNLLRVDSRNGRITPGTAGTHLLLLHDMARRGDWAVATRVTATSPGTLIRFPLDKPHEMVVLHEPTGAEFAGEIEELDLAMPGVGNMHGWLVRPPTFDGSRRYPLLVEVHGGPHAMAGAGYAPSALAHAAAGWMVLRLNPRGSTGFGFDLSNGLGERWPGRDVDDLRAAINALIERGLVDSTHIAVAGTGAGAATAFALRAAGPRISATILRCADGDWLPGGSGVDRPPWNEWHAARPFAQRVLQWWPSFAATINTTVKSPVLLIRGRHGSHSVSIADALRSHAASTGAATREFWVDGECRDAGSVGQLRAFEAEQELLESLKD